MLKRLFPSRWARIVAWTAAAVAWGTSILTVQAARQPAAAEPEPVLQPEPEVQEVPEQVAAVPEVPEEGLVVIRYTPVPPPPPEVITRTVTVGGGGGGGSAAASGGGNSSVNRPAVNAVSSGS